MHYLDDEKSIIESFQSVQCNSVYFPVENSDVVNAFESIYDPKNGRTGNTVQEKLTRLQIFTQIHI